MKEKPKNIYAFEAVSLQGVQHKLENYKGKVVLVVNTASKCGLTPQYEGLEKLYRKYRDKDFVILGFPCNQFGNQEPDDGKSIEENCLINYGVSFPMYAKVDVNGPAAHPLFQYLTAELPGVFGKKVGWNFTKFLINADGKPIRRFAPFTSPESIEASVVKLLK